MSHSESVMLILGQIAVVVEIVCSSRVATYESPLMMPLVKILQVEEFAQVGMTTH
jgi:hypothetical protein